MPPGAGRGGDRHDDERGRRRRADLLAEDVHEHRQREDRAAAADRADDQADGDPERDREHDGIHLRPRGA